MMNTEQIQILKTVIGLLISHEVPYMHGIGNRANSYYIVMHNEDNDTTFTIDTWKEGVEYILALLTTWNGGMAHTVKGA